MRSTNKMWIAFLLLIFSGTSFAEQMDYMDGKTLQSLCADYEEARIKGKIPKEGGAQYMRCPQYMQGLLEASIFYERITFTVSANPIICFPRKTITTEEAISVTNEYLRKHPEKGDSRAVVLVMAAFFEAYACNK